MAAIPKKIVWLASYPKSGNTWFRAFLTALLGNGDLNINEMIKEVTDLIFCSRDIFNYFTDVDTPYLYDDEVKLLQPEIFKELASFSDKERLFIKIHDAYILNKAGAPIVPTAPTQCALYFIRNPLDIVGSLANHSGSTIAEAISLMNNPMGSLSKQSGNRNTSNHFKQLMLDWSGHVGSWTVNLPFPVMVIRYEDMLTNTLGTFKKAVEFMGLEATDDEILKAISECSFDKLKEKENKTGFRENNNKSSSFFRSGSTGNWIKELTYEQILSIKDYHTLMMTKYTYL